MMLKSEFKQRGLRYQHWHPSKPTVQHTTSQTNHLLRQLYSDADAYHVDLERDVEGVLQNQGWMKMQSLLFDATAVFNLLGIKRDVTTDKCNEAAHQPIEPCVHSMKCDATGVMKLHDIKGWLKLGESEPPKQLQPKPNQHYSQQLPVGSWDAPIFDPTKWYYSLSSTKPISTSLHKPYQRSYESLDQLTACDFGDLMVHNVKSWLKHHLDNIIQIVGCGFGWICNDFACIVSNLVRSLVGFTDLSGIMMLHDLTGWLEQSFTTTTLLTMTWHYQYLRSGCFGGDVLLLSLSSPIRDLCSLSASHVHSPFQSNPCSV
jgi:hypothetical protein